MLIYLFSYLLKHTHLNINFSHVLNSQTLQRTLLRTHMDTHLWISKYKHIHSGHRTSQKQVCLITHIITFCLHIIKVLSKISYSYSMSDEIMHCLNNGCFISNNKYPCFIIISQSMTKKGKLISFGDPLLTI